MGDGGGSMDDRDASMDDRDGSMGDGVAQLVKRWTQDTKTRVLNPFQEPKKNLCADSLLVSVCICMHKTDHVRTR